MSSILEIKNLNYKDFQEFNLSIQNGKFYTIVGGNGSGKSILLEIICGIILTNKVIRCNKILLSSRTINEYIKSIGVIRQLDNDSFLFRSVKEELEYPLYNLGYSRSKTTRRIKNVLTSLHLMNIYNKNINDLTISNQQLLLFVIALLHGPKVLLIDDALNILNKSDKKILLAYLSDCVRSKKMTVINFTINLSDAFNSDYLFLLKNSSIQIMGTPKDLVENDKIFYENGLEIPFMVDLSIKLKLYNLISKVNFNMEDLVNDIWK